jgi:multiple antibiotic resistance protein
VLYVYEKHIVFYSIVVQFYGMVDAIVTLTFIGFFLASFSALFVIMNPLSTATLFLTLTEHESITKRRKIAAKTALTAAIVLIVFATAGNSILYFFGITVDAFRIAGGILIAQVGYGMLKAKAKKKKADDDEKIIVEHAEKEDIAIIPLAIPSLSGPGAMTTAIVLMGETGGWFGGNVSVVLALYAAIITVAIVSFFILRQSLAITKYVGSKEQAVIAKVLGLIVFVVGIQFMINGILGIIRLIG